MKKTNIFTPASWIPIPSESHTWCIEMKTVEIPSKKFIVKVWPNKVADAKPVKIVAIVDEYFFKIVSAWHKQKI